MASTISTLRKKFMGRRSKGEDGQGQSDSLAMEIGTPTNVKRLIHAELDAEHGMITGLPPELHRMFEALTTAEERLDPDNNTKFKNAFIWMTKEEEKQQHNFIRCELMPGSSGESTVSALSSEDSEEGVVSSEEKNDDDPEPTRVVAESNVTKEHELEREPPPEERPPPLPVKGGGDAKKDTSNVQEEEISNNNDEEGGEVTTTAVEPSMGLDNVHIEDNKTNEKVNVTKDDQNNATVAESGAAGEGVATLRRKGTAAGKRPGPRVTRNITEEEVYAQMRALCTSGDPLHKYDRDLELGSGAAGTVFLALDKATGDRVAIKIIDLQKQPKKEMILMELKVSRSGLVAR